jgi:hypothetical protein
VGTGNLPFFLSSNGEPELRMQFTVTIPSFGPKNYTIHGDDCIEELRVDGVVVPPEFYGPCEPATSKDIHLPALLAKPGIHFVQVRVSDSGGMEGFDFHPALFDPLIVSMQLLILCLVCASVFFAWKLAGLKRWSLLAVVILGIALRILYFNATPFSVRSNDADAHVEYVQWMLDHRSIPMPNDGWEFFQPPLYYAISSFFAETANSLFGSKAAFLWSLQLESLLLSIGTLLAGIWVGCILFPYEKYRRRTVLFASLVATFPALIFSASKINNDVLVQMLSVLAVGFLLRFWQTGKLSHWSALNGFIILGMLTKLSMVFYLPPAYLCLFFSDKISWRRKWGIGLISLLIVLVCTEWFYVFTYLAGDAFPVGNRNALNPELAISNGVFSFFGFNPVRFISLPFLNPFIDESGRQYFWEYVLKSSLFGEYDFGPHIFFFAQILLSLLFVVVPIGILGLIRTVVSRTGRVAALPMLSTFFFVLLGHILLRIASPFSCSQDFRYSLPALLPFFQFLLLSSEGMRSSLRVFGAIALWAFVVLCAAFIVLITIFHPL